MTKQRKPLVLKLRNGRLIAHRRKLTRRLIPILWLRSRPCGLNWERHTAWRKPRWFRIIPLRLRTPRNPANRFRRKRSLVRRKKRKVKRPWQRYSWFGGSAPRYALVVTNTSCAIPLVRSIARSFVIVCSPWHPTRRSFARA